MDYERCAINYGAHRRFRLVGEMVIKVYLVQRVFGPSFIYKWIEVYIDIYGCYAKIIFNKTYFNKGSFSKENYQREK